MRRTLVVLVTLALVSACTGSVTPPAPNPSTTKTVGAGTSRVDPAVLDSMGTASLQQVSAMAVGGDVNLALPLHRIGGGTDLDGTINLGIWKRFFAGPHNVPSWVEVAVAGSAEELASLCIDGTVASPELTEPVYCREREPGGKPGSQTLVTPQEALIVLPPGFTAELGAYAIKHGSDRAWQLATIITGLMYSQHLRHEYRQYIGWPDGPVVDYCLAGMSARAVLLPTEQFRTDIYGILADLDTVMSYGPDITPQERAASFFKGFEDGQLKKCLTS